MKECKKMIVGVFTLLMTLQCIKAHSQKRWDGEAGDNAWNSPLNWNPDGLPNTNEDVLLDNSFLYASYSVILPSGTTAIEVNSLHIKPSKGNTIITELPPDNLAAPALVLGAALNTFFISEGGSFINRSGATAGNTILLNGPLTIQNGGKYIHRTIRGNAAISSRLVSTKGAERGVMEFDVPGNANYTVSLSGRNFGNLSLRSGLSGKKSYSGSGGSDLRINGELDLGSNCSFNPTLTGNIRIGKSIKGDGSLSLNPATFDTVSRQLIFSGDSCSFSLQGVFNQGPNFRNILVEKGTLTLKSDLTLSHDAVTLVITAGAAVFTDTFAIKGRGKFISTQGSLVSLGSPNGISEGDGNGNIQLSNISINTGTQFVFNGPFTQRTGKLFPDSIDILTIDKSSNNLILSKNLTVLKQIHLKKGIIVSRDSAQLTSKGVFVPDPSKSWGWMGGHRFGFIDGELTVVSDSINEFQFPIGRDTVYAPIVIIGDQFRQQRISAAYFPHKHPIVDSLQHNSKNNISTREYWTIKDDTTMNISSTDKRKYIFSVNNFSQDSMNGQHYIIHFNETKGAWESLAPWSTNPYTNTIGATSSYQRNGIFTFGKSSENSLSQKTIRLDQFPQSTGIILKWTYEHHEEVLQYRIEKSVDGTPFYYFDSTKGVEGEKVTFYRIKEPQRGSLFRISAIDKNGFTWISNQIYIRNTKDKLSIIPNPANKSIHILPENREGRTIIGIIDAQGKFIRIGGNINPYASEIELNGMRKGFYYIILQEKSKIFALPFVKQ